MVLRSSQSCWPCAPYAFQGMPLLENAQFSQRIKSSNHWCLVRNLGRVKDVFAISLDCEKVVKRSSGAYRDRCAFKTLDGVAPKEGSANGGTVTGVNGPAVNDLSCIRSPAELSPR